MGTYLLCLFGLVSANLVYGQTSAPKVCWDSKWFNESSPTTSNRKYFEQESDAADPRIPHRHLVVRIRTPIGRCLDSICTTGKVIAAQCKDEKGEPIQTSFRNDSVSKYVATCEVVTGLICHPYNNSNQTCPDFAIQYGCPCPTNSSAGGASAPSGGSVTLASKIPGSSSSDSSAGTKSGGTGNNGKGEGATVNTGLTGASDQQHGQCRNGVPKYEMNLFILISCSLLKTFG